MDVNVVGGTAAVSEDGFNPRRKRLKGSGRSGIERRGEKGVYF